MSEQIERCNGHNSRCGFSDVDDDWTYQQVYAAAERDQVIKVELVGDTTS